MENRGVQLRVLGPLQVSSGDRVWSPGGPKERRLLAILVLHLGEVVSVDALAEALWEGAAPRSAVKTVQVYMTRLRAALAAGDPDGDLVQTVGRGYRLALPAGAVDAYAFVTLVRRARRAVDEGAPQQAERHLVDAFALWRGEPYGEFADGAAFAAEAQRLAEIRLAGLEVRLAAGLACGRDADVVAEAQALCAAHPLHEQFWVHLVTALYRCGRQADALAALRRVRALLAEEIGADPGAELRILEQRVLRQDPTLATPAHPGPAAPLPPELDPAGRPLFGRAAELAWLEEAWADVSQGGRSRLLVIAGPAGRGRTRLAAEFAARLHARGIPVHYARVEPGLAVLDDLDDQSVAQLAAGLPDGPTLCVATYDPATATPALRRALQAAAHEERVLAPLGRADIAQIVARVAGPVDAAAEEEIVLAAHGRPGEAERLAARLVEQRAARPVVAAVEPAGPAREALVGPEMTQLGVPVDGGAHTVRPPPSTTGLAAPVAAVHAAPTTPVAVDEQAAATAPATPHPGRLHARMRWVAVLAAAVLVAAAAATGVVTARGHRIVLAAGNVVSSLTTAGRVTGQLPVGDNPTAVTAADGTVWVTNTDGDTVSRIDPIHGRELARIADVGHHPAAVAVDNGTAWVVSPDENTLTAINTTAEKAVETVLVGQHPSGVAVGAGAVWVTNSIDNNISKIDPDDPHRTWTFPAGTGPTGIAVSDGAVWVTNVGDGTVWKLDPATGSPLLVAKVGLDPTAVAVGSSGVWVANSLDDTVTHLDPTTGQVIVTVKVGAGPSGVAVTDNAVWVTTEYAGKVVKIDPSAGAVTGTFAVAGAPHGIAAAGGRLWLASGPSYLGHRGGELRVFATEVTDLEPSHLWRTAPGAAVIVQATSDGLVSYAHASGVAGGIVVPDLADALPTPGRTEYLFHLRPGIRFSTGKLVTPSDVRYSIERDFRAGWISLPDVVGADACIRKPATCDLSQGIKTDDRKGTVRIRLTRPNPRFLYALAENTLVVPTGTPLTGRSHGPVPGTGPYSVTRFIPGRRVELQRNPYFHQWSRAAQPDGYPDSIGVDVGTATAAAVGQVARDELDFIPPFDAADLPAAVVRTAARGVRLQLYDAPDLIVGVAILNTRLPPFNDVRVRKALNYAVDRKELVRRRMAIGTINATPACQVLIPGIGGYRPYCPYTVSPGSGHWLTPDFATAKELVRQSGTAGQAVTVWEPSTHDDPDGAYFVEVLTALGYKAHLHKPRPDFGTYIEEVLTPGKAQLAVLAWSSTPRGDDLVQHLLCRSFDAKHNNFDSNFGGFCDRRIDQAYDAALRLALTDGTAANNIWAQVDRQLVDAAPWVPAWNVSTPALASPRVGNITRHFFFSVLLDQLWVR
jgi:YVTN family beta-propeller protein